MHRITSTTARQRTCNIWLWAMLLLPALLCAQQPPDSRKMEDSTYALFLKKEWKQLAKAGNYALKHGMDYHLIRTRLGIAAYEQQHYRRAIKHFRAAQKFNSNDPLTNECLYFSSLFAGRESDARLTAKLLPDSVKRKYGIKQYKAFDFIYSEGGIKHSSKQDSVKDFTYYHQGINHHVGYRVSIYQGFTGLNGRYYWGSFGQLQYYISCSVRPFWGFTVTPALHFLWINALPHLRETPMLASLELKKSFRFAELSASGSYSNLAGAEQLQQGISALIYPFAGQKLALAGTAFRQQVKGNESYVYLPSLLMQPLKWLHINLQYYYGNTLNLNEANGLFVNNSIDLTKQKISLLLNIYLNKWLSVYLFLQQEQKTEKFFKADYTFNTIIGGIKIRP